MTREQFLENVGSWDDHRILLWEALEITKESKLPVIEYGAGNGSTPYLRQYCLDNGRTFISYENNEEWAKECGSTFIISWDNPDLYQLSSVSLVDCAPGEVRHEIMLILKDRSDIVVVHDSEAAATGYMLEKVWPFYQRRVNVINVDGAGAEATAVSNKYELHSFVGKTWNNFKVVQ
jgi:hypothetical protein